MPNARLTHILFFITGTAFMADAIGGVLVYVTALYRDAVPGFPGRTFLETLSEKITEEPMYAVPLMIMNGVCIVVGAGMILHAIFGQKGKYSFVLHIFPLLGIITALFRPFAPYLGPEGHPVYLWLAAIKAAAFIACITLACIREARTERTNTRRKLS